MLGPAGVTPQIITRDTGGRLALIRGTLTHKLPIFVPVSEDAVFHASPLEFKVTKREMYRHFVAWCFLLAACTLGVLGQKCYVCKDQEENTGKCTTTVEPCDYGEEYCLSEIKWGSTPYWQIGAPMQHFISKRCATKDDCVQTITKYMPNCLRIWWKDWTCAECCKGDRCNYYITLGSSSLSSSLVVVGVASMLSLIIQRIIY